MKAGSATKWSDRIKPRNNPVTVTVLRSRLSSPVNVKIGGGGLHKIDRQSAAAAFLPLLFCTLTITAILLLTAPVQAQNLSLSGGSGGIADSTYNYGGGGGYVRDGVIIWPDVFYVSGGGGGGSATKSGNNGENGNTGSSGGAADGGGGSSNPGSSGGYGGNGANNEGTTTPGSSPNGNVGGKDGDIWGDAPSGNGGNASLTATGDLSAKVVVNVTSGRLGRDFSFVGSTLGSGGNTSLAANTLSAPIKEGKVSMTRG